MKTKLVFAFLFVSMTSMAQFPPPTNLIFEYQYIMIDETGYCDGQWISGPAYCSHFNWSPPDTSSTEATLDHYSLYYNQYWYPDTTLILYSTVQDTFFTVEDGFIGEMWVTAVYTNPQGESEPSNVIINPDLPISVERAIVADKRLIRYDSKQQLIKIIHSKEITSINLFDCRGILVHSYQPSVETISLNHLEHGLYIIKLQGVNSILAEQKIIK
ncbi:MAG: T9SS type A sorting domain-containing protein [Bacteroidota bacterium]